MVGSSLRDERVCRDALASNAMLREGEITEPGKKCIPRYKLDADEDLPKFLKNRDMEDVRDWGTLKKHLCKRDSHRTMNCRQSHCGEDDSWVCAKGMESD